MKQKPRNSWLFEGDFPDPFVLMADDGYWAFATNAAGCNVQVRHSTDLTDWMPSGDALPHLPSWAAPGRTWAPAVLARAGRYVLYVTVRGPGSDRQAIMVAVADRPAGRYEPVGTGPLVFQLDLGGSIDPSPFVDGDGSAYLLWKADANALNRPSSLWAQPLTSDGLALRDEPSELLRFDATWEKPLIEAPAMVRDGDRYYLFYSAGWWGSDGYGIGYAVADHPLGPWNKVTTRRAWVRSDRDVSGPGGQEFFTDRDGRRWMAYHGWEPGQVGYEAGGRRTLRLAEVQFIDGQPRILQRQVVPPQTVEARTRSWWRRR